MRIISVIDAYYDARLWFLLFRNEFMALPWLSIILVTTVFFVLSRFLVKPVALTGSEPAKRQTHIFVTIASALLLSLFGGILYVLLPEFVNGFLLIYLTTLLLGLLTGGIYFLISNQDATLKNAISLFAGNFYLDTNEKPLLAVWHLLSRQIWEQPQTLIGNALGQILNSFGFISEVVHCGGITLLQGKIPMANGVAFGSFIMVTNRYNGLNNEIELSDQNSYMMMLIRHEMGHNFQSRCSGPLYLYKYGIPSAMNQTWTEQDAEFRSDRFLLANYGIAPVFGSYPKSYQPIKSGIVGYLILIAIVIYGIIWGGIPGLAGAYLFFSGMVALLNLGKRPSLIC